MEKDLLLRTGINFIPSSKDYVYFLIFPHMQIDDTE